MTAQTSGFGFIFKRRCALSLQGLCNSGIQLLKKEKKRPDGGLKIKPKLVA
jgi:hypothetical protein